MSKHTTSGWEKAMTVATCLQTVAVIISLVLIVRQLNQQTLQLDQQLSLSRAANTQSLVSLITPLNLRTTEREMTELWIKGAAGIKQVTDERKKEVQSEQYETLVASYMIFYENTYSQYKSGLLDQEIYDGWDKDLAKFIAEHKIADRWNEWKAAYRADFSSHVDDIIAKQKPQSRPATSSP